MWDTLFLNAKVATMRGDEGVPYGLISDAAIAVENGDIAWVGPVVDIAENVGDLAREIHDVEGDLITPGLIDCHTHLVYAGDRSHEFEARLLGKSYEDIAKEGGGIRATVAATRSASAEQLFDAALTRLDDFLLEGVTTIEVKSGYGLDAETEMKMLHVARALEDERQIRVRTTFLAAHALPPEFKDGDAYIAHVCEEMLPAAHAAGLVDSVDGFCETVGFTPAQIEKVFEKAQALGLPVKLHAEQLSNQGGAKLAARYGALSADHLEYLDPGDAVALAEAGTVATLLPGAFYYLRETKLPPVAALREAGVDIAVATDCNPGSSPMTSILLAMNMGSTLFQLTAEEALAGATRNAARALALDEVGEIRVGARADLCVWDASHPAELVASIGQNPLLIRIFGGDICP
jgi:imidazolonepropionase